MDLEYEIKVLKRNSQAQLNCIQKLVETINTLLELLLDEPGADAEITIKRLTDELVKASKLLHEAKVMKGPVF